MPRTQDPDRSRTRSPLAVFALTTLGAVALALGTVAAHAGESRPPLERAATAVGSALDRAAAATAHGLKRGAEATEHGIRVGLAATAHGIERGAQATARAAERVAEKVKPESTAAAGRQGS